MTWIVSVIDISRKYECHLAISLLDQTINGLPFPLQTACCPFHQDTMQLLISSQVNVSQMSLILVNVSIRLLYNFSLSELHMQ